MKNILVLVVLFISTGLFAQEGAIRGTILDQEMNSEPLIMANISLKELKTSKQTNLFGKFEFNDIKPGEYTVQINFAGYDTKEITVRIKANEFIEIQETLAAITFDFDETTLNSKTSNEERIAVNTSNTARK